jgi:hypothetical protein
VPEAIAAIGAGVAVALAAKLAGISGDYAWFATWLGIVVSATAFAIVFAVRGVRRRSKHRRNQS